MVPEQHIIVTGEISIDMILYAGVIIAASWGLTEMLKSAVRARGLTDDWLPRALALVVGAGFGMAIWPSTYLFGESLGAAATLGAALGSAPAAWIWCRRRMK